MKPKELRGAVRIAVKEILPELLKEQLFEELKKHVDEKINVIETFVRKSIADITKNHTDTMNFLVRKASVPPTIKKD